MNVPSHSQLNIQKIKYMKNRKTVPSAIGQVRFAAFLGVAFLFTACSDDLTGQGSVGKSLQFEVAQNSGWSTPQSSATPSRAADKRPQTAVYSLSSENGTDTLYLHSTITDGIETDAAKVGAATRATPVGSADAMDRFRVYGYMKNAEATSEAELYMDDVISRSGTGAEAIWNGTKSYYWPGKHYSMRFFAYAPSEMDKAVFTAPVCPDTKFSYEVPADASKQEDLMIATTTGSLTDGYMPGDTNQPVSLSFGHVLTAVKFTVGDIDGTIHSITLKGVKYKGKFDMAADLANAWALDDDTKDFPQSLETNLGSTPTAGTEITTDPQTFMMVPQELPDGAQIEVVYSEGTYHIKRTLTADIEGSEWLMGTTVNYKINASEIDATRVFDIGASGTLSFSNTSTNVKRKYNVESYIKYSEGNIPRTWKVDYDSDDDGNFDNACPNWLTFEKASNSYTMTVKARTATGHQTETHNNLLWNTQIKGSDTAPYNLANSGGNAGIENTANCYIVNAAGTYSLPLVYGNAIENGGTNEEAYTSAVTGNNILTILENHAGVGITSPWIAENYDEVGELIEPYDALLLWQDAKGLITDVSLQIGGSAQEHKIVFTTATQTDICQGNAVIAVRNADKTILWSWHIWVTDWESGGGLEVTSSKTTNVYNIMPINLGWCYGPETTYDGSSVKIRFTQGDNEAYEYITVNLESVTTSDGHAPFYQWGRKDPMLPALRTSNKKYYDISGVENTKLDGDAWPQWTIKQWTKSETIHEGIKNPQTFCYNNSMDDTYCNLWGAKSTGTERTILETEKTIYDPCPVGYKIPVVDMFCAFTSNGNTWTGEGNPQGHEPTTNNTPKGVWKGDGWNFETNDGGTVYFPITYYRNGGGGGYGKLVTVDGNYWTAVIKSGGNIPFYFIFSPTQVVPHPANLAYNRAYGLAVRPVKEKEETE